MNRNATRRIALDTRESFDAIRQELDGRLQSGLSIDEVRQVVVSNAPAMVTGRARLLFDTLLNYLMKDAMESLAEVPTSVRNDFFALDLRARINGEISSYDPGSLRLAPDARVVSGGLAAVGFALAGGLVTFMALNGTILPIAGGLVTLIGSAGTFRLAHGTAAGISRRRLEKDMHEYVTRAEQDVTFWLASVEKRFVSEFDQFQADPAGPGCGTG